MSSETMFLKIHLFSGSARNIPGLGRVMFIPDCTEQNKGYTLYRSPVYHGDNAPDTHIHTLGQREHVRSAQALRHPGGLKPFFFFLQYTAL